MKKMYFGRVMTVLMTVALVLVTGTVFSGGEKETKASSAEKVKLTFLANINVDTEGYDVNTNPYIQYIEERNNVDIDIINESDSAHYDTKMNTVMASGDLPDYMLVRKKDSLTRWAREGLIIPLDDYVKNTKYYFKDTDQLTWDICKVDGKIYGFPCLRYDKSPFVIFVRKDFVTNLGIDTNRLKTLDDYYKMLVAFVKNDPDKNGKDDTFGIVGYDTDAPGPGIFMFLDVFDGAEARFIDGEVRPFYLQEGYKNWLKFMNKLYREKILDPEYMTTMGQMLWEKAVSGKYGMFYWFWSIQEYRSIGGTRDDLIAIGPPEKVDGSGRASKLRYWGPVRHYISISKTCKNPQKVVDIMDWALSEEGGAFIHAGLEGMDYDLKDGKIAIKPERRGKNWAWRFLTVGVQKAKLDDQMQFILKQSWGERGLEHLKLSDKVGGYDEIVLKAPYFLELAKYDLDTKERIFRNKAIMGQIDIDKEWNNFIADWKKSGGNEWIRLYTEWYKKEGNK
jgi:putative aldouronate transport system substrate-binding protein